MEKKFKVSSLLFVVFLAFSSSLSGDFLDSMVTKVTDKVTTKAESVVDEKSNQIMDATNMQASATSTTSNQNVDKITKLKDLIQMKKDGYLTDEEFANEKAKLQM